MSKSKDRLARSYALDLLKVLNDQPHMNKEKLFADAVAYYRWLLKNKLALESLEIYWHEFEAHHQTLVASMERDIRVACFITWFVEQRFHELPPLAASNFEGKLLPCETKRFSRPSFRLPTGDPSESYLVQWVYWHLDNLPGEDACLPGEQPPDMRHHIWAREMIHTLSEYHEFAADEVGALTTDTARFFKWCLLYLGDWDMFMKLFMLFLRNDEVGRAIAETNTSLADAYFVVWFCQAVLNRAEKDQSKA